MGTQEVVFSGKEQARLVAEFKTKLNSIADSLDASAGMIETQLGRTLFWKDLSYGIKDISAALRRPFDKQSFDQNFSAGMAKIGKALGNRYTAMDYSESKFDIPVYAELLLVASAIDEAERVITHASHSSGWPNSVILHTDMPKKGDYQMPLYYLAKALSIEVSSLILDSQISRSRNEAQSCAGYEIHLKALKEFDGSQTERMLRSDPVIKRVLAQDDGQP